MEKLAPIRKYISNRAGKKSFLYLGIIILASLLCLGFVWHFSKMPEIEKEIPQIKVEPKARPLTPEQIKQFLEKKVPEKEKPKPLTPEEIQKALEKLR